jgi:periplasmic divalent cation tolerance protein
MDTGGRASKMTGKIVAFTTCATEQEAVTIARRLLETRVAACVSIVQPVRSLYHWQGAIQDDCEQLLIIKSRADLAERLKMELQAVHSYETPELVMLDVADGLPDYLAWIDRELGDSLGTGRDEVA